MTFDIVVTVVMICAVVVMIIKGTMHPGLVMSGLPMIAALLMGFGPTEIATFAQNGLSRIVGTLCLVIFAILYFRILHESGLFQIMVDGVIRRLKGNVYSVIITTALISFLTQLDGSGTTTALCTIPPLKPMYDRMNISRETLLLIEGVASATLTMIPWGPSLNEACAYAGVDVYKVFKFLTPVMIFAIALTFVYCIILGRYEISRGAGVTEEEWDEIKQAALNREKAARSRKGLLIFNSVFTLVLLIVLLLGLIKTIFAFVLGFFVLAAVNYPSAEKQTEFIRKNGGMIMQLVFTMMGVGVLVGINDGTGVIREMTGIILSEVPGISQHIVLIACIFSIVLTILTAQAKIAVIIPAIIGIVAPAGISAVQVTGAVFASGCVAASINFFGVASYLSLSLADVDMRANLKRNFVPIYVFSLLVTGFMAVTGMIPV